MPDSCDCFVLSGRGLCEGLITRPEESYRLCLVVVCDQETSYAKRLYPRYRATKYKLTIVCRASRNYARQIDSQSGRSLIVFLIAAAVKLSMRLNIRGRGQDKRDILYF